MRFLGQLRLLLRAGAASRRAPRAWLLGLSLLTLAFVGLMITRFHTMTSIQQDILPDEIKAVEDPRIETDQNESVDDRRYPMLTQGLPKDLFEVFYDHLQNSRQTESNFRLGTKIKSVPTLPQPCLDQWLSRGDLTDQSCLRATDEFKVDFVWTWLNGSDPIWKGYKIDYSSHERIGRQQGIPDRHYRDHDELRASLRSVESALEGEDVDRSDFHIALTDWAQEEDDQRVRIGQRPEWLVGSNGTSGRKVEPVWHSEMWSDYGRQDHTRDLVLKDSLPTFNSFSIETNLFNIPNIAPQIAYLNDDFFLTSSHSMADFHSPGSIFGPLMPFVFAGQNFRFPAPPRELGSGRWSAPRPIAEPLPGGFIDSPPQIELSCNHEWSSLARSNYLLGLRFGTRHRPGHMHIPKPLLTPIMHEVALIWGKDHLSRSTTRRFREDGRTMPGDYNPVWLTETLLTERAREAMLWTWAVAKLGEEADIKGTWGHKENMYLRRLFGVTTRKSDFRWPWSNPGPHHRIVPKTETTSRSTLSPIHLEKSYEAMGVQPPKQNQAGWTSLDGPLPPWGASIRDCEIDFRLCFGTWWTKAMYSESHTAKADSMFRYIAFEKPTCGDCLLSFLLQSSGPLGMAEILPTGVVDSKEDSNMGGGTEEQPHLPLTENWKETDFSFSSVVGRQTQVDNQCLARDWTERLISRYAWSAIFNSTAIFSMVSNLDSLTETFAHVNAVPAPASVAINDDLPQIRWGSMKGRLARVSQLVELENRLALFLGTKWPMAGNWERGSKKQGSRDDVT